MRTDELETLNSMSSFGESATGGAASKKNLSKLEHDLQRTNKVVAYLEKTMQRTIAHIERVE